MYPLITVPKPTPCQKIRQRGKEGGLLSLSKLPVHSEKTFPFPFHVGKDVGHFLLKSSGR